MVTESKQATIAIDIDDVLAYNAAGFIEYSNQHWDTQLTVNDYNENWAKLWNVDEDELRRRAHEYHVSGAMGEYQADPAAEATLRQLHNDFRLIVITSRRLQVEKETLTWMNDHFPDVFDAIHFAGIWDDATQHSNIRARFTKADLCQSLGADYLIDDQLKHCVAAAECGVKSLLFGSYAWNKHTNLPAGVTAVADWAAVKDYFYGTKQ